MCEHPLYPAILWIEYIWKIRKYLIQTETHWMQDMLQHFCGEGPFWKKVFLVIIPNKYLILLHCVYRFHICNHIRHIFQGFFISNHLFLVLFPKRLQLMLLNPLKELSNVLHADIRQKQLESVLQILQSQGDSLGPGWPLVLGVIGAIRNDQG